MYILLVLCANSTLTSTRMRMCSMHSAHIHARSHAHVHAYICTRTHTRIHIHTCAYTRACVCVCAHARTRTRLHVHLHAVCHGAHTFALLRCFVGGTGTGAYVWQDPFICVITHLYVTWLNIICDVTRTYMSECTRRYTHTNESTTTLWRGHTIHPHDSQVKYRYVCIYYIYRYVCLYIYVYIYTYMHPTQYTHTSPTRMHHIIYLNTSSFTVESVTSRKHKHILTCLFGAVCHIASWP